MAAASAGEAKKAEALRREYAAARDAIGSAVTVGPLNSASGYYPTRESLGAALLLDGEAEEAEKVFRADLEKHPRNGRSLYGLAKALEAQKRAADAAWAQTQFDVAWKGADTKLRLEDM